MAPPPAGGRRVIPFMHRMSAETMEENPLWLIVLCDMMTNLMLFFLIMYSFTQATLEKQREFERTFKAKDVVADAKETRAEAALQGFQEREAATALRELLRRADIADWDEVSVTERQVRVRLRNKLLFPPGAAELAPEASKSLYLLARVLGEIPNEVEVEGHTDDSPILGGPYRTNWELSIARADAVLRRLAAEGVAPKRLIASGYGEHHPLAENATPAGRAANRRVEIVIHRGAGTNGG